MPLKNFYSSAYSGANSYSSRNKDSGVKSGDVIIGDYNYGKKWSEGDQAKYDLYLKSLEMDQNLAILDDERAYNSPQNQAALMRQAGLNPDLVGVDFESSSASPVASPSSPVGTPNEVRAAHNAQIAKSFLDLLPQALNVYSQIRGANLDIQSKQLSIDQQFKDIVSNDIFSLFTPQDWEDLEKGNLSDSRQEELDAKFNYLENRSKHYRGLNRRFARSYGLNLANIMGHDLNVRKGRSYSSQGSALSSRRNYLNLLGQYGMNMTDDNFVDILRDFNKLAFETEKKSTQSNKDMYDANIGRKLMASGARKLESGQEFVGVIEYILGMLMSANLSFSRSPKGSSFGISK